MCTVTLIARRNGYALGMNRDEKLTRVTALPPTRQRLRDRDVLFPSEPGGGTWIGVNDAGVTLALINWYSVSARVSGRVVSRGDVIKALLPLTAPNATGELLSNFSLSATNAFRLIGVFPGDGQVLEWRWDLKTLRQVSHPWKTSTWISSGFDEPAAQRIRGATFQGRSRQSSAGTRDWLRRLHGSHDPARGPFSTCMHRADAATVSYSEVIVSERMAAMRYWPGAPCCTELSTVERLRVAKRTAVAADGSPFPNPAVL